MTEQLSFWGIGEDGRTTNTGTRIVYFIDCGDYIKIGYTARGVDTRRSELQTGNPYALKIIGTVAVRDASDERRLHDRFQIFHYRDEWYHRSHKLLNAIGDLLAAEEHRRRAEVTAIQPIIVQGSFITFPEPPKLVDLGKCPICGVNLFTVFAFTGVGVSTGYVRCVDCKTGIPIEIRSECT